MEIRLIPKMPRECRRHALILFLSITLCAALAFSVWPGRASAQCGGPYEYEMIPGIITLQLTEDAAPLVGRDGIFAGRLTMGIGSLDSLNSRLGVTRIHAYRSIVINGRLSISWRVYDLFFAPTLTVAQTCSLIAIYQDDPNVELANGLNPVWIATTATQPTWGGMKRLSSGGE